MSETNFDWDDLRLFLEIGRSGGLSPAAQQTGKSAATLGRRLLHLEKQMGRELVVRHARGYSLTEQGAALFAQAQELEAQIVQAVRPTGQQGQDAVVRLSAGSWMARFLARNIARIVMPADRVRLHFIAAEHNLDILRREAVIGIRNARPDGRGLAAQKVADMRFAIYARDAAQTDWIGISIDTPSARWVRAHCSDAIRVDANSPRVALDLARAGAGRIVLPELVGDHEPDLVRLSAAIEDLTHAQWLVSHHEERFERPVRLVLNRVAALLRGK